METREIGRCPTCAHIKYSAITKTVQWCDFYHRGIKQPREGCTRWVANPLMLEQGKFDFDVAANLVR